jgi:hypothetical protein
MWQPVRSPLQPRSQRQRSRLAHSRAARVCRSRGHSSGCGAQHLLSAPVSACACDSACMCHGRPQRRIGVPKPLFPPAPPPLRPSPPLGDRGPRAPEALLLGAKAPGRKNRRFLPTAEIHSLRLVSDNHLRDSEIEKMGCYRTVPPYLSCYGIIRVRNLGERAIPSLSRLRAMTAYRLAPLPGRNWHWMIHRTVLTTTQIRLSP